MHLDPDPLERWAYVSLPRSVNTGGAAPFRVAIGTYPDTFEKPRETPDDLQKLITSTTLNGRIDTAGEVDRYELPAVAGEKVTLDFEDPALLGKTEFEANGARWRGGVVATGSRPALLASGKHSYQVPSTGGGGVIFDPPADSVTFFYLNRPRDNGVRSHEGTASVFNFDGTKIGSVDSTVAADSTGATIGGATEGGDHFVTLNPAAPIARMEFTTGVIDDFSWTKVPGADYGWALTVEASALGSPLDPVLAVYAADGERLFLADDDGANRDPRAVYSPPSAKQKMAATILTVEDLHRRGGKAYAYRLTVTPQRK